MGPLGRSGSTQSARRHEDMILEVLGKHVSRINAQSLLNRALEMAGGRRTLDQHNIHAVLQKLQLSVGVFVTGDKRRELHDELDALKGATSAAAKAVPAETVSIRAEPDIVVARTRARNMCEELGAGTVTAHKVATVVSELSRNIVSYTPGGTIELAPGARDITITAIDKGQGIRNLDQIMGGQYRSKTGMGVGLAGTKRLADSFQVDTGMGGTTITVKMKF